MVAAPVLEVLDLVVRVGGRPVVDGVSLAVAPGEVLALRGPNGAGKSTLLRTIAGAERAQAGQVLLDGRVAPRGRPSDAPRAGIALVGSGRRLFPSLTVEQNLRVAADAVRSVPTAAALAAAWDGFPVLHERRAQPAGVLSGGEQQQLVLARALVVRPRVLLLDEPTTGIAAPLASTLLAAVRAQADEDRCGVLLAEQTGTTTPVADRRLQLRAGRLDPPGGA